MIVGAGIITRPNFGSVNEVEFIGDLLSPLLTEKDSSTHAEVILVVVAREVH